MTPIIFLAVTIWCAILHAISYSPTVIGSDNLSGLKEVVSSANKGKNNSNKSGYKPEMDSFFPN